MNKTRAAVEPEPQAEFEARSIHGILAEFETHDQVLKAARSAYADGYRRMDAYSPFPVEGLAEALGREPTCIPLLTLICGTLGGLGGYFMQWISMTQLYPMNVGGRPLNSWPHFIPVTFEMTILAASVTAFTAVFVLNRLPQPHHPVFNVPEFERASIDRFFLCIESEDPRFHLHSTRQFLERQGACKVTVVED